jgi:hypothetical protein
MAFEGEKDTETAQQLTMRGPLRSPMTSSSVSSHRPPTTPLSTRARRHGCPLFSALRASPASSLLFAGESSLMRCVDDSRSMPRSLDTAPTRGRPPPRADNSAARLPPAGLFTLRSGRHTRNARGKAAPGVPQVLPRAPSNNTILFSTVRYPHRPPAASIRDGAR